MGNNVFEGCIGIESIQTGKFTVIGKEAFKNCTGLRAPITLNTPNIGEGAFSGCTYLTGVALRSPSGESLEFDIGARAFENCGLDARNGFAIDFGNETIRTIGKNAFAGSGITKIAINDSFALDALRLGGTSFNNITVTLAEDYAGTLYAEENGVIYSKDMSKILLVNTSVTGEAGNFEIPASVTEIGTYAFANSRLTTVTFENASNLTKMGEGAFYASKIENIDLSGVSVTEIPAYAFYQTYISSVSLPATVKTVGDYAFAYAAINEAYLPSVETLGNYVFAYCDTIAKITTSSSKVDSAITLNPALTVMGDGVFYDCSYVKEAQLPALSKLGAYTFMNATNLVSASFDENATATGEYTFALTGLKSIALTDGQIQIGEGMFYGCRDLQSVTISSLACTAGEEVYNTVGAYAFSGCSNLDTVINLDEAVYIGDQAFYNTALTALSLDEAREIGVGAFAVENEYGTKEAAYTALTMPKVEKIGAYAFLNGGETTVEIGVNVQEIGYGAFASSKNLKGFKVAEGNEKFVALDADADGYGVLYRYIDKTAGTYEIVCYPAARTQAAVEGVKTYAIAEGTLYVKSAAFLDLNKGALDCVVLPHSVNVIGDSAFLNSGIYTYTFESVQAPVLETSYQDSVALWIESTADAKAAAYYKGYYYTNFQSFFYEFTDFGDKTSTLVMNYPVNGIGYDNYVYAIYFGTRTQTEIVKTDTTRDFINALENLPMDDIRAWATWDNADEAKKAEVVATAETIKTLRATFDSLMKDEGQKAFVQDKATALVAAEDAIRKAKANFGVIEKIKTIRIDRTSFKTQYLVGEKFDITGMKITIVYEDDSTRSATTDNLTVLSAYTGELKLTNNYVMILYADADNSREFRVAITVTEEQAEEPDVPDVPDTPDVPETPETPDVPEEEGCGSSLGIGAVILVLAAVAFLLWKKRRIAD